MSASRPPTINPNDAGVAVHRVNRAMPPPRVAAHVVEVAVLEERCRSDEEVGADRRRRDDGEAVPVERAVRCVCRCSNRCVSGRCRVQAVCAAAARSATAGTPAASRRCPRSASRRAATATPAPSPPGDRQHAERVGAAAARHLLRSDDADQESEGQPERAADGLRADEHPEVRSDGTEGAPQRRQPRGDDDDLTPADDGRPASANGMAITTPQPHDHAADALRRACRCRSRRRRS